MATAIFMAFRRVPISSGDSLVRQMRSRWAICGDLRGSYKFIHLPGDDREIGLNPAEWHAVHRWRFRHGNANHASRRIAPGRRRFLLDDWLTAVWPASMLN